jgi:hypothetical protein
MSPEVGSGAGEAALQLFVSKASKGLTASTIEVYGRLMIFGKQRS